MATLNQVRTRINDWLSDRWPTLVTRQNNYYNTHGKYWQGLKTHSVNPTFTTTVDGDSAPDQLNNKPTDVTESWFDAFPSWDGISIPAALQIDVYSGPSGDGWVATVTVGYDGTLYQRSQNYGPETWRTKNWQIIE